MQASKKNETQLFFEKTEAIPHLIIDDFLEPKICALLHSEMLNNQMWRLKNPLSKHLYNSQPITNETKNLLLKSNHIAQQMLTKEIELIDYWAILYSKNTDGNVHADFGQLTLTYWITPDKFNLNPETGGLLIYDVRRADNLSASSYLQTGNESEKFVITHTKSNKIIPYRCNRAVIFDSSYYHKTNSPLFDTSHPEGMRMNITLAYATKSHVCEQIRLIKNV